MNHADHRARRLLALGLAALCCFGSGCGTAGSASSPAASAQQSTQEEEILSIEDEMTALAASPAAQSFPLPEASGKLVASNAKAKIDYSNTEDGYVMAAYTASTSKKLKLRVIGPTTTYTYNLTAGGGYETFPLSDGNGSYTVSVYENISGSKYSTVLSQTFTVQLKEKFAPFLRPNQYVNYENAPKTIQKAQELMANKTDPLEKVDAAYEYVVKTLSYDREKAANVKSGYLPVLDTVLETKKGICFDYAALTTAMLRSQGIPCKLVVGYAGKAYHAWISVYTEKEGWIEGAIYFDGKSWKRMDPTFASSGKQSSSIMQYIGDGSHYTEKYIY